MRLIIVLFFACLMASLAGADTRDYETPIVAEARLRDALAAVPPDDFSPEAETIRADLAKLLVFSVERDFAEAIALLEPLLARAEAAPTPDPAVIESLQSALGMAHSYVGDNDAARTLLDAACVSASARLGPEHTDTLAYRGNRASFLGRIGETATAEAELRDIALSYHRRDPDADEALHARTQWSISLGRLGRWPEAESELRDIIARRIRLLGADHPHLTHQLNLLCWVLVSTDRAADAIPLMEQLVAIRTRELGPESPRTLTVRYNLASVYTRTGRYADAEKMLRADLAFIEAQQNQVQHETAGYFYKLGELALYRDIPNEAVALLTRAEQLYLAPKTHGWRDHDQRDLEKTQQMLALALIASGDTASAQRVTAGWLTLLEAQFNLQLTYTSETDRLAFLANENPFDLPGTLGDANLLARARLRLKGLVLDSLLEDQALARASADPVIKQLLATYREALSEQVQTHVATTAAEATRLEQLERELARLAVPNTVQRDALRADPAAFLAHLSSDTAFVGYLLYRHTLPGLKSEARYLALIATADGWQTIPLGRADVINDAIDRYHILIARGGPIAWAQEVRRLLLDPVREALPFTIKHLFVSPDGLLQSVPLATLPEADPAFIAADRHTFATVTSARDLLPTSAPVSRNSLVLAAPVWSGDLSSLAPLPASSAEGAYVAEKLGDATLLTGADATITALTQDHAPRVLHIATHALVVTDSELPAAQLLRRTGLALAGEPGFLDTLQISALGLHGTELVFLSGCETGGGVAANGEGVLGLQRGFARAGARALVLTLWPVADQDSRKFTEYFYDAFTPSGDAISALHLARKKFREELNAQGASPVEVLRRAGSYSISVRR